MKLKDFDELEELENTEAEEEQDEDNEPEEAEEVAQEPVKDTIDRSVPLAQRIHQELKALRFGTGIMADYELASATYLAEIIPAELLQGQEGEHFQAKWDENKWDFVSLWKAVQEEAQKQSKGRSFGCRDEIVLGWVRHIVIDTKNEPKKPVAPKKSTESVNPLAKAKPAPNKPKTAPAKPKTPKPAPVKKKDHEQVYLDLGELM